MSARGRVMAVLALAGLAAGCTLISPPSSLVAYGPNGAPTAVAEAGVPVTFTCSGTDPFKIHLYMWDFGDGKVTEWDKVQIQHTYADAGVYEVRVKERCPMVFGETCLMRTDWSMSLKLTVKGSAGAGRESAAQPVADRNGERADGSGSPRALVMLPALPAEKGMSNSQQ